MLRSIHHCLTEGAGRNPEGVALEDGNRRVSYRELRSLSERLTPVGEVSPVALWAEKSPEAVAAIFGVLASGRACIPIDPQNPPARTLRILNEARPGLLLASARLFESSRALARDGIEVRNLMELPPNAPRAPRAQIVEPDSLAYVLYTSGSTGSPKGIMISHRAVRTFADWAREAFGLDADDRVASIAPLHFDLSLFDLFSSLSAGASVCLCPRSLLSFPESLLDWLWSSRITTLYATPSLLATLSGCSGLERLGRLRRILFAGEVMPPGVLARLMEGSPQAEFYNLYGPTETNVCAFHAVARPVRADAPVPVGLPCPYNLVEVVAEDGSLAEPGRLGEIRVTGPNVMSGYVGARRRADGEPYLTGDLGFRDEDGTLHFRGRKDAMLKIRGHRVYPNEVEAALEAHPLVQRAACYRLDGRVALEELAAAVILRAGAAADERGLRAFCATRLPPYMVPSRIEFRSELPLDANGKLDRGKVALDHLD